MALSECSSASVSHRGVAARGRCDTDLDVELGAVERISAAAFSVMLRAREPVRGHERGR